MKRAMAQDLDPPGLKGFPMHKHRVRTIMSTWLAAKNRNAPTPNPVAMSLSYAQNDKFPFVCTVD